MKNVIFFVVLAILTVAALVGWNAMRNQPSNEQLTGNKNIVTTPVPTSEIGTAVGRTGSDVVPLSQQGSTVSGAFSDVTKGNIDPNTAVVPSSTPVAGVPSPTKVPVVTSTTPPAQTSTVMTYTDNGFTPKTLTVTSGTMVKFVNKSAKRMWVVSAAVSGGQKLDSLNMGTSVGKDGTYEYEFTQKGTWGIVDQNNQTNTGSVVVQ